jgi:hypothetical protein
VASNMIGIADAMRGSPDMAGDTHAQRHSNDATLTCLIWQAT